MKSLNPDLQAHLDSGATTLCWCWRITRTDGQVFGFTEHDLSLTFDGTTFEPESGLIASEIRSGHDLAADSQDAEGVLTSDRITETDILDGKWDAAQVEAYRVNWQTPAQRVLMRLGTLGQVRRGRVVFVAEVRSLAHLLNQSIGRTFQAGCDAKLGDGRCKIDLELPIYKGSGSVLALSDGRTFAAAGLSAFENGWFSLGEIEWLTGANAGRRVDVIGHANDDGAVELQLQDLPVRSIAPGDTFFVRAGCDKLKPTCVSKFANAINYQGFWDIPGQDAVIRYATRSGGNTGNQL